MKMLVAVAMAVMIPPGIEWQVSKEPPFGILQKDVPRTELAKPQPPAQEEQQRADDVLPPVDTKESAPSGQPSGDQADKATETRKELTDSDKIQQRLADLTEQLVWVGWGQLLIIVLQVVYGVRAANAARKSADVAHTALEVVERASLSADGWKFLWHPGGTPIGMYCVLHNGGGTPAQVVAEALHFAKGAETPPAPDFLSLPLTREGRFTVPARGSLGYAFSFADDRWRATPPNIRRGEVLFSHGYLTYLDDFGGRHHLTFFVRTDLIRGEIAAIAEPGYSYVVTEQREDKCPWYRYPWKKDKK